MLEVGQPMGFIFHPNNFYQQYKLSNPVVRNMDISAGSVPYNFGSRLASGGKYRSSYYYPKSIKNTTPSPGGPNPVWVVWGRQGTPFEDYNNYQPNDFQQFGISGANGDEVGNNYLYGNNLGSPYQDELASYPSGWSWTRADTEGSEELNDIKNSISVSAVLTLGSALIEFDIKYLNRNASVTFIDLQ
ncbi:unnamed protein product [Allacma fusca]|uniref:Uncharacterized protein n=1 Tax=Allacma fusca TaxID=39272 RepID=A0A8J2J1D9_9HEXA|nr:unnamed protein product [Allacma fusca]